MSLKSKRGLTENGGGMARAKRSGMRRKLILFSLAVVTTVGFVGCATDNSADRDSHRRTTGQYIDDKMLVQRVKAALDDSPVYKFPDVKVNTFNGTVQLTGFVETDEQKRKAEDIAKTVRDVLNVQNQITLKGETERVRDLDRTIDGDRSRNVNDPVINTNRTTIRP
jgi:osmotically-inducible protein OsmY